MFWWSTSISSSHINPPISIFPYQSSHIDPLISILPYQSSYIDPWYFSMSRQWTRVLTIFLHLLLPYLRHRLHQTTMLRWNFLLIRKHPKKVFFWKSVVLILHLWTSKKHSFKSLDAQVSESDNCSSVATAQIPVPQQRSSIRRNEYVNIPIPPRVSFSSKLHIIWNNKWISKSFINSHIPTTAVLAYTTRHPIPSIF